MAPALNRAVEEIPLSLIEIDSFPQGLKVRAAHPPLEPPPAAKKHEHAAEGL